MKQKMQTQCPCFKKKPKIQRVATKHKLKMKK
jgi:hypothetical protein